MDPIKREHLENLISSHFLSSKSKGSEIIAEIGTGHEADLSLAKDLISAAKESGADTVKFQHVIAGEIIHPKTGMVELPGGPIALFQRFKQLEKSISFYKELIDFSNKKEIGFLCTPFGTSSAADLISLGQKRIKIASPELNFHQLLHFLKGKNLSIILSTGVSKLADIEESLSILENESVSLLHCSTAYPTPEEDYNILTIPYLKEQFQIDVGLSDHSLDPVIVPVISTAFGAHIIEKHFCLSRIGSGLDDPIALEPFMFMKMTESLRNLMKEKDGKNPGRVLDYLLDLVGEKKLLAVLGHERKELSPSEMANYERTNRSIHALGDMEANHCLKAADLACLRTEKILKPGLHPRHFNELIGRKTKHPIEAGQGVNWKDLVP